MIIFVSDMTRSVAFYRDILGFILKFESSHWTEFKGNGLTLALHLSDNPARSDGNKEPAGHCRPGFQVLDLDEFHNRMTRQKVTCIEKPAVVFGSRIAKYADPDGLIFSVSEEKKPFKE